MSATDDIEFKIARLDLRPGDILVFKCPQRLSIEAIERMQSTIKKGFPDHRSLILENGLDLSILTPEEVESRVGAHTPLSDTQRPEGEQ